MSQKAKATYDQRAEEYQRFITTYCKDELSELLQKYPSEKTELVIDWSDVYKWNADVAHDIRHAPEQFRNVFTYALKDANTTQSKLSKDGERDASVVFKNVGDPQSVPELIRGDEESKMVTLRGQVAKTTAVEPRLRVARLKCKSCKTPHDKAVPKHGDMDVGTCPASDCRSTNYDILFDESEWDYHQLARIEQPPEEADGDTYIDVHLTGDAAGELDAGERADISGVLRAHFEDIEDPTPVFFLEADGIEHHESDYEDIDVKKQREDIDAYASGEYGNPYDLLVQSIAPSIVGEEKMNKLKMAVALQMFGGWRRPYGDGRFARGDMHIALIGEPGTGKSSLLDAAEALSPRSAFTSGKNASSAGITAAAVRDDFGDTEWNLEAGVIVKAHKGIACIDEIDKVDPEAISSLHTALEKQKLEVNKAGIDASLPCQTSLLAAGNPEDGKFIDEFRVLEQINLPPALRSRFDLIFTLRDDPEEQKDKNLARHISKLRQQSGLVERGDLDASEADSATPAIPHDILRAWIAHARQAVFPVIPMDEDDLHEKIADYFADNRDPQTRSGLTARAIDGVSRLAEASARVRLSETVEEQDLERAMKLMKQSFKDLGLINDDGGYEAEVIETNTTHKEREETKNVKGIIETLEPGDGDGVEIDDVVEAAQSAGISQTKAERDIQRLIDANYITRPDGHSKVRTL